MKDSSSQEPTWLLPLGLILILSVSFLVQIPALSFSVLISILGTMIILSFIVFLSFFSKDAQEQRKRSEQIRDIPLKLTLGSQDSIQVGIDRDLHCPIFLPDSIRTRHVHILGATGSGKTESVILNFLAQDCARGLGSIILDAKGDRSFTDFLLTQISSERLELFDLSDPSSRGYNPLAEGSPLESAQRLYASLTWSEEYYRSKALSFLQKTFQTFSEIHGRNPKLDDLNHILQSAENARAFGLFEGLGPNQAAKEFQDLSGLRDQITMLTTGHLKQTLSPKNASIKLSSAQNGKVLYFRLQSLMSPQLVTVLGRLLINHLNFIAGTFHRTGSQDWRMTPIYLDEFASFACLEFADLISKARSAGFALHFAHQSVGDVTDISQGFLNRITDNTATKIVMRINDPDSADFMARCFGTKEIRKLTHRVTHAEDAESAESIGEGSIRETHQFRASPDLLKNLPTGVGAVLISHGIKCPDGASHIFQIQFPKLNPNQGGFKV